MYDKHILNKETDSKMIAMDIVNFLQKWGMWQDVQIFTGGKCYTDSFDGKIEIRDEEHPDKYLGGPTERDCNGEVIWKEFSNPERLLDNCEYYKCVNNVRAPFATAKLTARK